jgi:Zn-dependent protease
LAKGNAKARSISSAAILQDDFIRVRSENSDQPPSTEVAVKQALPPGPNLQITVLGVPTFINWTLPFFGATIAYLPAKHGAGSPLANYLVVLSCLVALLVLHELGHALVAKACSLKVRAIIFSAYGGCCISDSPSRLSHAALLAAGGLIAQLVVLIVVVGVLLVVGSSESVVVNGAVFALVPINALYMLVNIAPFRGSDGAVLLSIAKRALSQSRQGSR